MRAVVLLLIAAGCGKTDSDVVDTDDTDVEAQCVELTSGTWSLGGSCYGMAMTATLTYDPGTCGFTLDDFNMSMGENPEGGTLEGDTVTLYGGDLTGCTGTAEGDVIEGTCDGGCAFGMQFSQ